jgi:hypothetical protein
MTHAGDQAQDTGRRGVFGRAIRFNAGCRRTPARFCHKMEYTAIFEYGQINRKHRGNGVSAKRSGSFGGSQSVWLTDQLIVGMLI